jgi:tetratricopeptide (TPR) repeat protein
MRPAVDSLDLMNIASQNLTPSPVTWREIAALAFLLTLICVLAWPAMEVPPLLDDISQLRFNAQLTSWRSFWGCDAFGLFRPAKNVIFHVFAGLPVFQWHAINLAFFLASTVAVFSLLRRVLASAGWAFLATALWATCPTQTSAAVWMSCSNISLAVVLSCVCVFVHDDSRQRSRIRFGMLGLIGLSLFMALCCYETAVSVPALCVLADLLKKRRIFSREAIIYYSVLAVVTLGYLAIRSHFGANHSEQSQNPAFSPDLKGWQLSLSAPWFLWKHFSMWLMPLGRIEMGGTYLWGISASPWELGAAWGWLCVMLAVIWAVRKRLPWVSFGLLWFLATSFPPSNFIPVWAGPIGDYYLIFPGIGLSIALSGCAKALVERLAERRFSIQILLGGAALWRALCIPLFWFQANLWRHPLELYLSCETSRPAQFQVQALAAQELYRAGNLKQAWDLGLKSHNLAPWFQTSGVTLGSIAFDSANFPDAEKYFRGVIELTAQNDPINDFCRFKLAQTLSSEGSKGEIIREILMPLLNNPSGVSHLDAINFLIDCYLRENRPEDARRAASKAVKLHPDNSQLAGVLADIERKYPAPGGS